MRADAPDAAGSDPLSRRAFVASAASAAAVVFLPVLGCSPDPASPPGEPFVVEGDVVRLQVDRVPGLATVPGFYRILPAGMVVLRTAAQEFRAFSATCTHAGCTVNRFADARIHCPCHGSEYDLEGRPVAGPAPLPLTSYPTAFDPAARLLTITRTIG